jgi:hypothetical protein
VQHLLTVQFMHRRYVPSSRQRTRSLTLPGSLPLVLALSWRRMHARQPREEAWASSKVSGATCVPTRRGTDAGSRERPGNTQLEQRLAHLEQLLASIPNSASGSALSAEERKEIHRAAQGTTAAGGGQPASPGLEGGGGALGSLMEDERWRYETDGPKMVVGAGPSQVQARQYEQQQQSHEAMQASFMPQHHDLANGYLPHPPHTQGYDPIYQSPLQPSYPLAHPYPLPIPNHHRQPTLQDSPSPQQNTTALPTTSRKNMIYRSVDVCLHPEV